MSRVLGVVRLSRERDESTSVERQRAVIEKWADLHGHTVAGWAEDVDVSGAVAPWDRPGLGPWLSEREADFDVLAAWKVDRLSRKLLDLMRLIEWCDERRKRVVGIDDSMDSGSPTGKTFINILAVLAEAERDSIRARTKASFDHLMKSGRWRGGWVPYGYTPVKNGEGAGWALAIHPETSRILREIVRNVIAGATVNGECARLNEAQVPSPLDSQREHRGLEASGATWRPGNLKRLLASPTLLGQAVMTEETVTGEKVTRVVRTDDGRPLERAEPLISRSEFDLLAKALEARSFKRAGRKMPAALLLRVAYCECGTPMYRVNGRSKTYYRCGAKAVSGTSCGNKAIACDELDPLVTDYFLWRVGELEVQRREFVKGSDNAAEIGEVERALSELREDRAAGLYRGAKGAAEFRAMYGSLEGRREALEASPVVADKWRMIGTGQTYAERFAALVDDGERNLELRGAGVRVIVRAGPVQTRGLPGLAVAEALSGGRVAVEIAGDLIERVRGAAAR